MQAAPPPPQLWRGVAKAMWERSAFGARCALLMTLGGQGCSIAWSTSHTQAVGICVFECERSRTSGLRESQAPMELAVQSRL